MPCWFTQVNAVELGHIDRAILQEALANAGFKNVVIKDASWDLRNSSGERISILWDKGKIHTERGKEHVANELKRAYSVEVVKRTAKRLGWKSSQVNPNQFQVTRRAL